MQKIGLGRGLGSLIPKKENIEPSNVNATANVGNDSNNGGGKNPSILYVDINKIQANPYQPREHFGEEALADLTASIKDHGILQPLVATKKENGEYELIAGERRLRASKLAGLKEVPIIIKEADNFEKFQLAIIENIQRADLSPVEEAKSLDKLATEFHMTHEEIGKKIGKSRSFVTNTLRLLTLPDDIRTAVSEGKINASQSRSLVSMEPDKQRELFNKIVGGNLTSREVEDEVRKVSVKSHVRVSKKDPIMVAKEEQLQRALGTKVNIKKKGSGGQIIIDFYAEEELNSMIEKISK